MADEVFEQVLAKDPELRYQSAERFARDLQDLASGRWYLVKLSNKLGLATAPPTRPEPVAVPVPEPEPEPATGKARERQRTLPFRPRQVEHTLPDTSLRDFDDLDDLDEDETKLL